MKALPVTLPCEVPWSSMTPVAGGRYCGHCDRQVHDLERASEARVRALGLLAGSAHGLCARQVVDEHGDLVLAWPMRTRRGGLLAGALAGALLVPAAHADPPATPPAEQPPAGPTDPSTCEGQSASAPVVEQTAAPEEQVQVVLLGGVMSHGDPQITPQLFFARGKVNIRPEDQDVLREIADVLANFPDISCVTVEGHTSQGEVKDTVALGRRRAEAVRAALLQLGVQPERLAVKSWGEELPRENNNTAAGREANRRVSFLVSPDEACAAR